MKGQRLEVLWREAVSSWTDGLVGVLPVLLENPQLSSLAKAGVVTLGDALDVVRKLDGVLFLTIGINHLPLSRSHE